MKMKMKMKTAFSILIAIMATAAVAADRPFLYCDTAKSSLCSVSSIYEFEEASDFARTSEVGGVRFLEPDGANVANSATHKTGSYALDHTAAANSYLYVPRASGPSGQFTTNFWIYVTTLPSASGKRTQILSTRDAQGNELYPRIYLCRGASTTNICYDAKEGTTDNVRTLTSATAISASTWTMVSVGQHPYSTAATAPYARRMWISINAGTKTVLDGTPTVGLAFPDVADTGDFIIGDWLNSSPTEYGAYKIDQLASWGGTFSPADLSRLYNGGSGCAFPFVASGSGC